MCIIENKCELMPFYRKELYFVKRVFIENEYLESPIMNMKFNFDRVYFEDSDELIGGRTFYPASFHAYTKKGFDEICESASHNLFEVFGNYPQMYVPCIVEDIVACDEEEVAGRVIYLFSKESWKKYQERNPITLYEDDYEILTEEMQS